jgi:TatD family-associated radical SAM protein
MNILYRLEDKLFVNITNVCPCDCIFCIRKTADGMNENESLWLEREPTLDEIKAAFDTRHDLSEITEIVFCGFGEPMERDQDVITLLKYFKKHGKRVRINTNGLVRLINPHFDISQLADADCVSISLNADDAEEYNRVTRPRFGIAAYDEVLRFAADVKKFTNVTLSVVNVLAPHRIENCREIARNLGATFRLR